MEDNKLNNPSNLSYTSNTPIGLLRQLILTINVGFIPDLINSHLLDKLLSNNNTKSVYDQIYLLLLLNQLKDLSIEEILYYIVKNKIKIYIDFEQQLLIYIKDKTEVEKSRIIKIIKIVFTLFGKKKKLVIFTSTNFATNNIRKNIIYTTLGFNN